VSFSWPDLVLRFRMYQSVLGRRANSLVVAILPCIGGTIAVHFCFAQIARGCISEVVNLQLRTEIYNSLNHSN
jgi:hypothetical protein